MKKVLILSIVALMIVTGCNQQKQEQQTMNNEEAKIVIECETMTAWHQTEQDFRNDTPKKWYDGFDAGIHTIYIGEVIGAWKR